MGIGLQFVIKQFAPFWKLDKASGSNAKCEMLEYRPLYIYKFKKVTWLPSYLVRLEFVWMFVCLYVSFHVGSTLHLDLVRLGQLLGGLRCVDKRIFNIMKVYIERNNMLVELIRFRKTILFIHVYFSEARNSMQHRSPNAILHSWSCQTVFIVIRLDTMGGRQVRPWPFNRCVVVDQPITLLLYDRQVRLWPFNRCVVVDHPIMLLLYDRQVRLWPFNRLRCRWSPNYAITLWSPGATLTIQ